MECNSTFADGLIAPLLCKIVAYRCSARLTDNVSVGLFIQFSRNSEEVFESLGEPLHLIRHFRGQKNSVLPKKILKIFEKTKKSQSASRGLQIGSILFSLLNMITSFMCLADFVSFMRL